MSSIDTSDCIKTRDSVGEVTSLYRYRTPNEYTVSEIDESYLHFSTPCDFNDPFDCYHSIEGADSEGREELIEMGITDEFMLDSFFGDLHYYLMGMQIDFQKRISVCCFSERWNSISMWTHYAKCHTGVCIEYDFEALKRCNVNPLRVKYSKNMIVRPYVNGGHPEFGDLIKSCLNKSDEFESDMEWRAIKTKQSTGDNVSVPGCIKSVTFGCRSFNKHFAG